jgi:hypothetical protein
VKRGNPVREEGAMRQRTLYEERSGWAWWVHPLILLTLVAAVIPLSEFAKGNVGSGPGAMPFWAAALSFLLGVGIPAGVYSLMGQLRTRITEEHIDVRWGYLDVIKKRIPIRDVEKAEAVTYSPLAEFGGWGIRVGGNKKRAWTVRGNRALLLHLKNGTRFYLGSDRPERLLQWLTSVTRRSDA